MKPIWTKEQGWSRSPWPYVAYGFAFAAVVSVTRFFSNDHIMSRAALAAVPSLVAGPIIGLLVWVAIRAKDRLLGSR